MLVQHRANGEIFNSQKVVIHKLKTKNITKIALFKAKPWITNQTYTQPVHKPEDNSLYLVANNYSYTKYAKQFCSALRKVVENLCITD